MKKTILRVLGFALVLCVDADLLRLLFRQRR